MPARATRSCLSLAFLIAFAGLAPAQERVPVEDSDVTFPARETREVAGKQVDLRITGVALREKAWFNVYAVASYVDATAEPKSARELAQADVPKVLVLVMERDVDGDDMAEAFHDAILLNHSESKFKDELRRFNAFFEAREAKKGKKITFTHLPGKGVECAVEGNGKLVIENVAFARAIWDLYLGPKNIGEDIKEGLISRLR